jgi:hypothetical protein
MQQPGERSGEKGASKVSGRQYEAEERAQGGVVLYSHLSLNSTASMPALPRGYDTAR